MNVKRLVRINRTPDGSVLGVQEMDAPRPRWWRWVAAALAAGAVLYGCAPAKAATAVLVQGAYSYGDGGEFDASTTANGDFVTFCVQSGVDFYPGTPYGYNLTQVDSQGQPLTLGAAYLYSQFALGTLAGYDYADPVVRKADAGLLQAAIWGYQNQAVPQGYGYAQPTADADAFVALVQAQLGDRATQPSDGAYGVDIMQMYSGSTPAQAQLAIAPEPSQVAAMVLLGGVLAVGLWLNGRRAVRLDAELKELERRAPAV